MSRRFLKVVDQLYKAGPLGLRTVTALSRADAERLPRLPNIAVISITTPGSEPANLDGFGPLLRLSFADVDFLNPDLPMRARARLAYSFTKADAQAIWHFMELLPNEYISVVVHCEGGFSRSCAVALALHEEYGFAADLSTLKDANPSILQLMRTTRPGRLKQAWR
ncbi:hypothetical protein [Bordetella genomosp. 13]|uniref:hypothetical protein n=1 Tax=Bordetella genomosp. 13 TaxID=463040 RepID=UPI0011A051ED|nr:hypothetical protein [Bordetella genomosp. 13]